MADNVADNVSNESDNPNNPALNDGADYRLDVLKKLRIVFRAAQRHSLWIEKQCGSLGRLN